MSEKIYNVAIVGCGSMGVENLFEDFHFVYSFIGAVFRNPRTRLVALVDTDEEKLDCVVARLKAEGYPTDFSGHASLEEAVRACGARGECIDIVCCAAGPKMNGEVIRQADSFGVKGLYCEKPFTLSLVENDALAKIEAGTGLKIQINYLRNFECCHVAVLKYIRGGGIGELLTVRVNYKGGVLAVASHALAFLQLLFDKPLEVVGAYSPLLNGRCLEDPNVDGIVRYKFGERAVNVSLMATGRGDPLVNNTYIFELEFTGTTGRISVLENGWRIRYERMESSRVFGGLGEMMPYDTAAIPLALGADAPREFLLDGLEQLLEAIDEDGPTNASVALVRTAEEVVHALAISAETRMKVVLPIIDRSHVFIASRAGVKLLRQEAGD